MVGAIVALCLIGLAQIYSATSPGDSGASSIFFTQIWAILLGLVVLAIVLGFDYRSLADKSHFVYVAIMALLVGVLVFGVVRDRKSTRLNSSHGYISYAVFCLKKKK